MKVLDYLKGAAALHRIATALERIAAAQEELVTLGRLTRSGGSGLYSGYTAPDSVQGSVMNQSDEQYMKMEELEARRARGEYISEEEEKEALGE